MYRLRRNSATCAETTAKSRLAPGVHSCHKVELHTDLELKVVIDDRRVLRNCKLPVQHVPRTCTPMKTSLLSQHAVEHENITQCTHTSPLHTNNPAPQPCTALTPPFNTEIPKHRLHFRDAVLCFCCEFWILDLWASSTLTVWRFKAVAAPCRHRAGNSTWITPSQLLFSFFFLYPQKDYTHKRQVKVQSLKLNQSITLLWAHLFFFNKIVIDVF